MGRLPDGMEQTGMSFKARPSWRHPVQRWDWRRRHGKAPGVVVFSIKVDTAKFTSEIERVQRRMESL